MKKILIVPIVALACSAMAQTTITWDGSAGDGLYTNGANWGGTAPTDNLTTDIASWSGGVELNADRSVHGLAFTGGGSLTDAGNDNTLTLGGGGIDVTGGGNADIYSDVVFAEDSTITLSNKRISFRDTSTVSGSGNVTITGGNIAYFDVAASSRTGGTEIKGGAIASIKSSTGLGSGSVTLDNGTVARNGTSFSLANNIIVNSGGGTIDTDGWIDGQISGSGDLTIIGQGNEKGIQAGNTLSGNITLDNTVFRTSGNDSYGTGDITLKNGAIIKNNSNHLTLDNNVVLDATGGQFIAGWNKTVNVNGIVSGDGEVTFLADSGSVKLANNGNTYTGGTKILGSTVVNGGGVLGTGTITFDGGSMKNNNSNADFSQDVVVESGGATVTVGWTGKRIAFNGAVSGDGALTVADDSSTLNIGSENNTYSGGTTIIGGVLTKTGGLGTGDVTINNANTDRGLLKNNGGATTLANNIAIGADGARFQAGWDSALTLDGVLSGTGTLNVLADSGSVIINGDGTYNGLLTVESGATLGGNGSIDGDLTINDGGFLSLSSTLGVDGTVSLLNTFGVDDVDGFTADTAIGTYTLIGETLTDFSHIENFGVGNAFAMNDGKSAYFENGSLTLNVIPEPATLGLVAAFGASILFIRRRFMI